MSSLGGEIHSNADIQLLFPYWTSWTILSVIERQQSPTISSQFLVIKSYMNCIVFITVSVVMNERCRQSYARSLALAKENCL